MKIIVDEENIRLDHFLVKKLEFSRSKVQKLIKNGSVTVNDSKKNNNYLIRIDDVIEINEKADENTMSMNSDIDVCVVYEDPYLLVINKQSGLVVHPANGHYDDTLVNALLHRFKLSDIDSERPGIVHRIDKDTSGLMLVAKDNKAHELLANMIKNKEVERVYWALVDGVINHNTGTIDAPIGRDPNNRQKMCVTDKFSKEAITNFRVLKRYKENTLVECKLDTGRTHQIRVHFNYIGYPVYGDPVYGRRKSIDSFGQYLHSKSIRFIHPITKEKMFFDSELPEEFRKKLEELEK